MALTERQKALIRTSFEMLRQDIQPRSVEFYENFFRRVPEVKPMFRLDDIAGQGMRFMTTLAVIVDNLDHPEALAARFEDLGQAHRALGVKASLFAPMGEALIETLQGALGPRFTDEMRQAWQAAYDEVTRELVSRGKIPED